METAPERPKNFDPLQHCLDCLTVEEEKASVKSSNSTAVSVQSSESIMKRNGVEEENCFHSTEESMRAHEAEVKKTKAEKDRIAAEQMVADYDNDAGVFVALDKADSDEEEEEAAMETTAPEGPSSLNGTGAVPPGAVDASSEEEQPSALELLEQMRTVLEAESTKSGEKDIQIVELEAKLTELEATNQQLMEDVASKAQDCAQARDHLATKGKQFDYLRIAVLAAAKAVVTGPPMTSTTTQAE